MSKFRLIAWAVIPVILGVAVSYFIFSAWHKETPPVSATNTINVTDAVVTRAKIEQAVLSLPAEPRYFYTNKDLLGAPKVSAKAYVVGDLHTGEVILSKNQTDVYPIASVSKLMTALVTSELSTGNEVATVSRRALSTYGQNGELRLGEKVRVSDLIYPLLLESSNDAAEVLAEHFGRDSFMAKMNETARNLKMEKTSYKDPSGLSSGNQSTASDIFKLTGYLAREKPDLLRMTTKRSFSTKKHTWSNISQFLAKDGYIGGKSGYTDAAKQTVVSLFSVPFGENGERPIAITLLQSADRKKDVENILAYVRKNIYYGGALGAITDWVEDKVGVPDIREPDFVTLAFGGDIMLDRGVRSSVVKNFGNDYSSLFEKVDIFKKSDIAFANLEGPVSDQGKDLGNLYSFRMDPSSVTALKGAGMSVLSLANNHIGDWGRDAYIDTMARLKENEILYTGGGSTKAEAEAPVIIEKYGIKIGFLAFSDVGPSWMEAKTETPGILLANDPRFEEIISNAKKQVDHLVVSFHFGEEYKSKHNARQEDLAHKAIDSGAKIVIGHHPHWTQDVEVYKNGYIAYSLGNLVFDQSWSKETMKGLVLSVKLWQDGSMTVQKIPTELNKVFQLEKPVPGKEEKIKFAEPIKTEPEKVSGKLRLVSR